MVDLCKQIPLREVAVLRNDAPFDVIFWHKVPFIACTAGVLSIELCFFSSALFYDFDEIWMKFSLVY